MFSRRVLWIRREISLAPAIHFVLSRDKTLSLPPRFIAAGAFRYLDSGAIGSIMGVNVHAGVAQNDFGDFSGSWAGVRRIDHGAVPFSEYFERGADEYYFRLISFFLVLDIERDFG
ncbi:MAG: hypothetical protein WAP52_00165 [Candidatus Sungiibacteriota bacterium]